MHIIITSKNPVKVQASLRGFKRMFNQESCTYESVSVSSQISDQPMSDQETLSGAKNRVSEAMKQHPHADFWIGLEAGVDDSEDETLYVGWVYIRSQIQEGKGRTGSFTLPPQIRDLLRQGKELGEADDIVFQKKNSKQKNGAIGLLSKNIIDRTETFESAVILALIPFINPDLYPDLVS